LTEREAEEWGDLRKGLTPVGSYGDDRRRKLTVTTDDDFAWDEYDEETEDS
jgi:hypothetical protein